MSPPKLQLLLAKLSHLKGLSSIFWFNIWIKCTFSMNFLNVKMYPILAFTHVKWRAGGFFACTIEKYQIQIN